MTVNVLPRKIENLDWDKMREFWENPVGNEPPTKEQTPNTFELSMLDSSILTDDQRLVMQLALKGVGDTEEDESAEGSALLKADMERMHADGKTYIEIAQAYNISAKDVIEVLKQ